MAEAGRGNPGQNPVHSSPWGPPHLPYKMLTNMGAHVLQPSQPPRISQTQT